MQDSFAEATWSYLSWLLIRNACPAAKSDRLKQAKAEADKEIQAYKQDKENSFQQKVSAVRTACCGTSGCG
jgi:Vacuolar (H+)-ATPase G subunit